MAAPQYKASIEHEQSTIRAGMRHDGVFSPYTAVATLKWIDPHTVIVRGFLANLPDSLSPRERGRHIAAIVRGMRDECRRIGITDYRFERVNAYRDGVRSVSRYIKDR